MQDYYQHKINKEIAEKTSIISSVELVNLPWSPTSGSLTDASGSVIV
jgi:hypothetical protein